MTKPWSYLLLLPLLLAGGCSDDTTMTDTGPGAEAGTDASPGDGLPVDAAPADGPLAEASADLAPAPDAPLSSDGGASSLSAQGTVTTTSPPLPASKVVVFWEVSSGSPDYAYKLGEAPVTGSTFSLSLAGPLPTEALNAGAFGVGLLALVKDTASIPDGKIASFPQSEVIGSAPEMAIIYRKSAGSAPGWVSSFPMGYSCGKVNGKQGSFVTFAPVDCKTLQVTASQSPEFPNWT